ncbi:MAG: hypothetical protein FWC20_00750 [Oscillospiraceae bacterium]|nr:hypothetical protein [Oscillospiraceae bacterium]MCL2277922.1 hypothetical protein [Oscillospiraceae bacterium]
MIIKLKKNERLVYAGDAPVRAPNGEFLPAVPTFAIVSTETVDPVNVVKLKKNERIVYAGEVLELKNAKERFEALKAGREKPPQESGTPLYIITDASNVNDKKGVTHEQDKECKEIARYFTPAFEMSMRKKRAAERSKSYNKILTMDAAL